MSQPGLVIARIIVAAVIRVRFKIRQTRILRRGTATVFLPLLLLRMGRAGNRTIAPSTDSGSMQTARRAIDAKEVFNSRRDMRGLAGVLLR